MGIPGSANLLMLGGGAQAYQIEQSLRFNRASSHYLNETFAAGQSTWTVSFWVKRANLTGAVQCLFGTSTNGYYNDLAFEGSDRLRFRQYYSGVPSENFEMVSSMRFRDPSAWYHIVLSYCASGSCATGPAADRAKIWVNNQRLTDFDAAVYPGANVGSLINANNRVHNIGKVGYYDDYLGAYIAEFNFIDGQLLEPDDFGEEDDNGVWRPIRYTGTYGNNNSVYLKFDPSATNGIGHDHSGNGNNWTANNFTTSGTGTDVMSDTPTNNFATLNPLATRRTATIWGGGAYADGNLIFYVTDSTFRHTLSTIQVPTGKWYVEIAPLAYGSAYGSICGLMLESLEGSPDSSDNFTLYFQTNQNLSIEGTNQTTFTKNSDVFSIAVDNTVSPVQVVVRKNDTIVGSNPYSFTANEPFSFWSRSVYGAYHSWNFGAQGFTYTPPSGYKALSTANLPAPDIADGSKYFNTVLYTGNTSSTRSITGVGFEPDLVWIKSRFTNGNNIGHVLTDQVRGASKALQTNSTGAEITNGIYGYLSSFNTDGFTLTRGSSNGAEVNDSPYTYAAWNWLAANGTSSNTAGSITSTVSANPSAGFSIVTFTKTGGTTASNTVGHGLGVAPAMLIVKGRVSGNVDNWYVYHQSLGATYRTYLNTTDASFSPTETWDNTAPTSTVFTVKNLFDGDSVAYCFAEVEGYSKFGNYTGNGSTNGPFVYCGFKPQWIMIKVTDQATTSWMIRDTARNPYNVATGYLLPNSPSQEFTNLDFDIYSNGFKPRHTNGVENVSGKNYIFAAFADNPFGGSGVSPATAR